MSTNYIKAWQQSIGLESNLSGKICTGIEKVGGKYYLCVTEFVTSSFIVLEAAI